MYIDIFVLLLLICVAESVIMFSGPFHRPSGPSQLPGAGGTRRPDQTHRKNPEAFCNLPKKMEQSEKSSMVRPLLRVPRYCLLGR